MLALYDEGAPTPCPAPFNLTAHVLATALTDPDKIALAIIGPHGADRWSYGRLAAAVRGLAGGLAEMGLAPGTHVLLRLGNGVEFPIGFLGAIAAGLIPVPTSAQLTGPEITKLAAEVEPGVILAGPDIALPEGCAAPVLDIDAQRAFYESDPADYVMGDPNRPAYVVYTSGTSGRPRGVIHAHRAVWARQMMWDGWYGLTRDDRLLHAGAFNWTYTLGTGLLDPWAIGATALIPAPGVRPAQLPLLLKRFDATIFAAAPGVYRPMLRDFPHLVLPKLRHGLSAGEKLPEATRAAWQEATGTKVYEALGMSECSTFISGNPARPAPAGASGYPQPGRRIAVLGPDHTPVERGEPGQLAVSNRDPGLMLGYLRAEAEARHRFDGEWFLTGDMVSMAEDGAITYLGRADDMLNAGGVRVSPLEVERALLEHPAIQEVAATEIAIKADTTVIAAFYTGEVQDEATLQGFAAERLARYKQPRLYIHMDALPKGANGKLNRRLIRQDYEGAHGLA
ncbi:class I adenylate-forming enzyme family protein [Rhodovulum adriaticum]|uniref:Acyl-CoA synthetase (AMP-forming)/AMP-acid ligase II n=1 Tax=Rhodovulum adriaticum TaxID=35804 RepID=A0A4R2NTE2_RHOAD|nr:class I adenylate-forming enzyme family protein [Rhodovulum adriaticum]MBK1635067.1 benzoate--CoA ligase [Rhodovulum adriaticum]TCP25299.1 acyl-CoA synthetase (AMP-forming)/AMP-acid ligase II [Rhodovulum adriaticum]